LLSQAAVLLDISILLFLLSGESISGSE